MTTEETKELLPHKTNEAPNDCVCKTELQSHNSLIVSQAVNRGIFTSNASPATKRICSLLGEEDEPKAPLLFTELDELFLVNEKELQWKETARWIKFEEKIEEGGERWSKPHVSTLPLHSLFELRTCIERGTLLFDLEANNFKEILEIIVNNEITNGNLKNVLKEKVMYVLLRNHRHHIRKSRMQNMVDLWRNVSCANKSDPLNYNTTADFTNEISEKPLQEQLKNKFKKQIPEGAEATNVLVGEVDFLDKPFVAFVRLKEAMILGALTEIPLPTRFLFILLGPKAKAMAYHQIGRAVATLLTDELFHIVAFKAKLREDLLAGIDEFLDEVTVLPPGKWDPTLRIAPPKILPSPHKRKSVYSSSQSVLHDTATQHDGGYGSSPHVAEDLKRTGKLFGGLINDIKRKAPWFASDFYDALNLQCLSAVLFIYLASVTNAITFGGILGDATDNMQGVIESFLGTAIAGAVFCLFAGQPLTVLGSTGPVLVFERLLFNISSDYQLDYLEFRLWIGIWTAFFCLILVATEASYLIQYFTRFTEEGFCTLISFIFIHDAFQKMFNLTENYPINSDYNIDHVTLYDCACFPPEADNVTSLFNETTEPPFKLGTATYNTTLEPMLKTRKLKQLDRQQRWLTIMNWSIDLNPYSINPINVKRNEDEKVKGSCFVNVIVTVGIIPKSPIEGVDFMLGNDLASGDNNVAMTVLQQVVDHVDLKSNMESVSWSSLTKRDCLKFGGQLVGKTCDYIPDIALISFILFFGTFVCSMSLKNFKTSRYFPAAVRKLISDFSIILSILIFCGVDILVGVDTPKLIVPSELKPTNPHREWFVYPFGGNEWWMCLIAIVPALLVTILVFMDQQITALILNRKEHKLKKGAGFHLDLFWIAILMILTSFMGLPWYVSATVISLAHIDSLKMETAKSAPGVEPTFMGVREQRVTGLLVFILIGLSLCLAPILKYIPLPVLFGIFLYMGISALSSVQFMDRLKLLLTPAKHQPDLIYLRHVPLRRIHLFTLLQVLCLVLLWVLKSTAAAIIFPVMLLALVGIRKAMECVFSRHDLNWLDDAMPEKENKLLEEKKTEKVISSNESEDSEYLYLQKGPDINISVN
ncbi:electrogenic sodium bicarbonate cotransporter 1-like [Carcharodon carcharias]|uniref:electrogenic sodium bicarbonate cotransporter 1-like n=1 Tax=Carcharodon carcharias TaxID=13397 RepID=UPI001B7E2C90|nr:electrogenic sodium bicarbonate cotransporter 1-like [Carcharodon carcharias]